MPLVMRHSPRGMMCADCGTRLVFKKNQSGNKAVGLIIKPPGRHNASPPLWAGCLPDRPPGLAQLGLVSVVLHSLQSRGSAPVPFCFAPPPAFLFDSVLPRCGSAVVPVLHRRLCNSKTWRVLFRTGPFSALCQINQRGICKDHQDGEGVCAGA